MFSFAKVLLVGSLAVILHVQYHAEASPFFINLVPVTRSSNAAPAPSAAPLPFGSLLANKLNFLTSILQLKSLGTVSTTPRTTTSEPSSTTEVESVFFPSEKEDEDEASSTAGSTVKVSTGTRFGGDNDATQNEAEASSTEASTTEASSLETSSAKKESETTASKAEGSEMSLEAEKAIASVFPQEVEATTFIGYDYGTKQAVLASAGVNLNHSNDDHSNKGYLVESTSQRDQAATTVLHAIVSAVGTTGQPEFSSGPLDVRVEGLQPLQTTQSKPSEPDELNEIGGK